MMVNNNIAQLFANFGDPALAAAVWAVDPDSLARSTSDLHLM